MKRKALKYAFPYTLPICAGFLFLGMSYGFFANSKGFSFIYPLCMSMFIFAGSMEFVTVSLLLASFNPVYSFLLTLSGKLIRLPYYPILSGIIHYFQKDFNLL